MTLLHATRVTTWFGCALLAALAACSPSQPQAQASATRDKGQANGDVLDQWARQARAEQEARAHEKPRPKACELVTAADMTRILGQPTTGSANEPFTDQTVCTYDSADGKIRINFQVDWGDAGAAMLATRAMNRAEPGIAGTKDDLGDGYTQMGPTLMIRAGGDLVTLQMMGVGDMHATARRMLDIARSRMRAAP